jgi:DNA primase
LNSLEGRVAAARAAAPVIAGIKDEALRPAYVRELAGWVSLPPDEVSRIIAEAQKVKRTNDVAKLRTDQAQLPDELPPPLPEEGFAVVNLADPINLVERQTLEVLVQCPQSFNQGQLQRIAAAGMSAAAHNALLQSVVNALSADSQTWLGRIQSVIPEGLDPLLRAVAAKALPVTTPAQLEAYASGVITKALERTLNREKAEALAELRRGDAISDPTHYRGLQQKLVDLETERRTLMGE